jgi:hypothetical protein
MHLQRDTDLCPLAFFLISADLDKPWDLGERPGLKTRPHNFRIADAAGYIVGHLLREQSFHWLYSRGAHFEII